MKLIATIRESNVIPGSKNLDPAGFAHRQAARAVVLNKAGQVALLWVSKNTYHKLPGGGLDDGEDVKKALERELLEEIGCKAKVQAEVGVIIEFRDQWQLKQTSTCYLAEQTGHQQAPDFTQKELDQGFKIVWANNIDDAIAKLEQDNPKTYEGPFIQKRDLAFLQAAKNLLMV